MNEEDKASLGSFAIEFSICAKKEEEDKA